MRIIRKEIKIYKFEELSQKQQEKAVENYRNINYDWWESICYDDAKTIGLQIESFDIFRGAIEGYFEDYAKTTAQLILDEYGDTTDIYILAEKFLQDAEACELRMEKEEYYDYGNFYKLEEKFSHDLLEEYLCIIRREYEYLTGDRAVKETLESNGYEFTEDGRMY